MGLPLEGSWGSTCPIPPSSGSETGFKGSLRALASFLVSVDLRNGCSCLYEPLKCPIVGGVGVFFAGHDVERPLWLALNLAASRFPPWGADHHIAVKNRDAVAKRMAPAQIAEAERLAREWTAKHKLAREWTAKHLREWLAKQKLARERKPKPKPKPKHKEISREWED